MSLFSRKPRLLHERHAAAHAVGQNIRGIFHDLADELDVASSEHAAVAEDSYDQAHELLNLSVSAYDAAEAAAKQADAIRSLVS